MEYFNFGTDFDTYKSSYEVLIGYIIESTRDPLLSGIERGCNLFVVHQDAIASFMDEFIECHDKATYRDSNKTILNLTNRVKLNSLNYANNLIILNSTANFGSIELWTHRYVGNADESTDFFLLDIFNVVNQTFRYEKQLFPDKTTNLHGKSIRVASFNIVPHVILRKSEYSDPLVKSGNQSYQMGGFDGLMMVEFCQRYNCSVEMRIDAVNMWGRIETNKTSNGILGNLAERQADVGFGGLIGWHVPVWILSIVVFIVVWYMHLLMNRLNQTEIVQQEFAQSFMNLLAIFLMQAANIRKQNVSDVILSVALLYYAFNLVSIYSSRNASSSTVLLFGVSIDTAEDLAQSGLIWLQTHDAWVFSLILTENPTIKILVSMFRGKPPSVLRELADQGDVAFAIGRLNDDHLMIGDWITAENVHNYQLMKEELYYDTEIAMATKTWPLMERFNLLIMRTAEAGVCHYQGLKVLDENNGYYIQIAASNSRLTKSNAPRARNLNDLLGGFFPLGVGLAVASIVFVIEISQTKLKHDIRRK
ncbi:uncharacterized protein LOC129774212 [Toxorhynchites rutilus septentrionalis]|uniref:uncharacterized protein LOC129774212 n=1 Tax=Toxorhynchites rutilus septentrionalis TaxID=329112 RepID=UPI00247872C0|nr:uncharacterized protein LOC129774212 [Toxorhynchites rutilus septentrionalis]